MITDSDIRKLKTIFATKNELKKLDTKMENGFHELTKYIGDVYDKLTSQLNEFKKEMNEFRQDMRDIVIRHQTTLENHDTRIARLEYSK